MISLTDVSGQGGITRGAHGSVKELGAAIAAYIDTRNADPKPFRGIKTAEDILGSAVPSPSKFSVDRNF